MLLMAIFMLVLPVLFFVTVENVVEQVIRQIGGEKAYQRHHNKTSDHGYRTAVDGIDRIADKHVDDGDSHTPDETCPDGGRCHSTPV